MFDMWVYLASLPRVQLSIDLSSTDYPTSACWVDLAWLPTPRHERWCSFYLQVPPWVIICPCVSSHYSPPQRRFAFEMLRRTSAYNACCLGKQRQRMPASWNHAGCHGCKRHGVSQHSILHPAHTNLRIQTPWQRLVLFIRRRTSARAWRRTRCSAPVEAAFWVGTW